MVKLLMEKSTCLSLRGIAAILGMNREMIRDSCVKEPVPLTRLTCLVKSPLFAII